MLETKYLWRQLWDVGGGFGRFGHQHPPPFSIHNPKSDTKIKSQTSNCHQHLYLQKINTSEFTVAMMVEILMIKLNIYRPTHITCDFFFSADTKWVMVSQFTLFSSIFFSFKYIMNLGIILIQNYDTE